jgi:hypothetical protein
MKKIKYLISISVFFILFVYSYADTGKYRILSYKVYLTPRSDGRVEIEYYQKWLVTDGYIPWITVGTANSNYQIYPERNKGNIYRIYSNNSTNWSGIKIELDKNYLPGETFEVGFTIIQSRLFYADEENYRLDFTPGWYDRAITEKLTISVRIFAPIDKVRATPPPTKIEDENLIWEVFNLGKGQKFNISISIPKNFIPNINPQVLKIKYTGTQAGDWLSIFIFFIIFFVFTIIIIILSKTRRYGRGGIIYTGGYRGGSSGRTTGGGGGFGGRASSCACACVSCACACACAGGGGAGCTKKLFFPKNFRTIEN